MVASTTAAGTINQTARGLSSCFTRCWSEEAPTTFSLTSASTAWGDRSKTTHWWPARRSRRTMMAPIRPRPIMPSCIKVTLRFEVFPDQDVSHARLECAQEIVPVVVPYDKQAVLELPLDAVQDDAVVQWFDERIVGFVKAYLALVRQGAGLREHLEDQFVEDPVAKIRVPKYLAASTLERGGRTYYF